MANTLKTLEEIRRINASFPFTTPIKEWKDRGKKVIGWICCGNYVPEEIIHASGMLPIRITGDSEELSSEHANAFLYIYCCSFGRSCLELAIKGEYNFLDGLAATSICDRSPRVADAWHLYIPGQTLIYTLFIPHKVTEMAHEHYLNEVREFMRRLEDTFDVEITDPALRESITVYNQTRELLKRFYELRKLDTPPISGAEAMEVVNASVRMPKEEFNPLLERLLDEIGRSGRALEGKARLMVSGCALNNPDFIKGLEDLGGLVVADSLWTGIGYFEEFIEADPDGDPLEAISRRYLNKFPHPRMYPVEKRMDQLVGLVKEFRIDGVVMETIRYCNPHLWENPRVKNRLVQEGVPVLELDVEYGIGATAQVRTRAQAFIEMLPDK